MRVTWRKAMSHALYGPGGFFVAGAGPAAHFRTSVHASPVFTAAIRELLRRVDAALDRPDPLDVVDIGAGRGELLTALRAGLDSDLSRRVRLTAVELAPRPDDLPPQIGWRPDPPTGTIGLVLATEWLDNVPLDVAERDATGWRLVTVAPDGSEEPGDPPTAVDERWLDRWWPARPGERAEIGHSRDAAWAATVRAVARGLACAVDYGHRSPDRPAGGTLTGYRAGRQVRPVPDGTRDLTAHVAVDSAAAAAAEAAGRPGVLLTQRQALTALGISGGRPPLDEARHDPIGYVHRLAAASAAAELTDPAGLGGHWWLAQPVGLELDPFDPRHRSA